MRQLRYLTITILIIASLALAPVAEACTGLRLIAKNGDIVVGRTMEFGFDVKSNAIVMPVGTELSTTIDNNGTTGFKYNVDHAIVGGNAFDLKEFADGINDEGLYVGAHYFPTYASYSDLEEVDSEAAMAPHNYATWLLAKFADVKEVREHFDEVSLVPVDIEDIKGPAPLHFVVHDRYGNSIVIEPLDKKLKLFENPLGVFTNSPTFDWHMTNLNNYINLTVTDVPPVILNNKPTPLIFTEEDNNADPLILSQFGVGSGLHGIPGDFTPPSRFVRAVAMSQSAIPSETAEKALPQFFHIMNIFDVPIGAVRSETELGLLTNYTVWTSGADLTNQRWYFRTYKDQTIRSIDLKKAVEAAGDEIRYIDMDYSDDHMQPISDVSTDFIDPDKG